MVVILTYNTAQNRILVEHPVRMCPLGRPEGRWKDIFIDVDDDEGRGIGNRR
jgi:hypothetical protein